MREGVAAPGTSCTVSGTLHASHTAVRFHHLSLRNTLAPARGDANFVAVNR